MSIPLWLQCTIFWCTSSRIMHQSSNHLRLVSWTWQWVHFTQMTSTVTRSQSNRAPLGCGGTRDSHHGCADDKSAATVWRYHDNMDQNLWGMFQHLVESMPRRIKAVLKTKGVQPGTSKVYLIKWPVSVYRYGYCCISIFNKCFCIIPMHYAKWNRKLFNDSCTEFKLHI